MLPSTIAPLAPPFAIRARSLSAISCLDSPRVASALRPNRSAAACAVPTARADTTFTSTSSPTSASRRLILPPANSGTNPATVP